MDIKEIYENLCYYDERHPDYDGVNPYNKDRCCCDNCFYGRTELAKYILTLLTHTNHEKNH